MNRLMAQLDERREALGILKREIAADIGVTSELPGQWARGKGGPRFPRALAYARLVGARIILTDGSQELAEGAAILTALPDIRSTTGVTYGELGRRMGLTRPTVAAFEHRPGERHLALVEAYAAGLNLWLEVAPATPVSPGTGKEEEA